MILHERLAILCPLRHDTASSKTKAEKLRVKAILPVALLVTALTLCGCETQNQAVKQQPASTAKPMDMLSISRGLSHGAVDVYDPSQPLLTMPAPPSASNVYSSPMTSRSQSVPVGDPSVIIYDIDGDTSGMPAPPPGQPETIALPDLQPPSDARGDFASPFDPSVKP